VPMSPAARSGGAVVGVGHARSIFAALLTSHLGRGIGK
jgi:hypothetical protein